MSRFAGRALDRVWFTFLALHIPISLTLDLQLLYPPHLIPAPLVAFDKWYTGWSRDPVVLGAQTRAAEWGWLYVFFWVEAVVQVPLCVVGAYGLWKNDKRVYPLLLAYGASTATCVLPCVWHVLYPTAATSPPLSTFETASLLGSYGPFMLIPLGMAVDMVARLVRIVSAAQERKSV